MKTYISKTKAKTNVFNIKSSISDAIINILMNHSNNIQCGVCDVPYENKDSKSDYYKKVDKKIKSCINLELSLKKDEKIKYTKISLGNKSFLYFYLSTKNKKDLDKIRSIIASNKYNKHKTLECLLMLCIKIKFLGTDDKIKNIGESYLNSDYYFGCNVIKEGEPSEINCLYPSIDLSEENGLSFRIHTASFKVENYSSSIGDDDEKIIFNLKNGKKKAIEKISAVENNKVNFMGYQSEETKTKSSNIMMYYDNTKNYFYNKIFNYFTDIFNDFNIVYEKVEFNPNYIVNDFIKINKNLDKDLIIIDNLNYSKIDNEFKLEEDKENFYQEISNFKDQYMNYLKMVFSAKGVIQSSDIKSIKDLDNSKNYLVISNPDYKKNIVIKYKNKNLEIKTIYPNSFVEALNKLDSYKEVKYVDFYTKIKYENFKENLLYSIQNYEIDGFIRKSKKSLIYIDDLKYNLKKEQTDYHNFLKKEYKFVYGENAKMKIIDSDVFLKNNENLDSSNHYIIISNDKNKNNFYNQLNAKYFNFNKIFATFENSEVQDFESFPSFKKPKEIIIVKTLDKNKLKKTSTEIKLKEDLFKNKFIKTIVKDNLINKKYTLIYFNITKTDKTKYINAVTVNIELKKNGIKINEHFKYNLDTVNIFEFKNKLFSELITKECKDVFESVYDDSFYIVDEDNEEVFSCYNSSRIPRIIGDTNIDSIKDFKEHGKLSRTGIHGKSYLPFYLSQTTNGNNEFTYVEKFNNYNLFFTSINNNNAKITKETLIYKTYTIYKDGIKNNDNLESLFYSCFTIDSLKVNSISKKTILQKIAELYILN